MKARDVIAPFMFRMHESAKLADADSIIAALDKAGFVICPKEPTHKMMQAGVLAWRKEAASNQVYAEPLAEACYSAMLAAQEK